MENDSLTAYLNSLERDDGYRVDRVLKNAPHETTEVVYFVAANGTEIGPFVRKRISGDAGIGQAYYRLHEAQGKGIRFQHLPRVYDVYETGGDIAVIMEYVAGHTLREEVYEHDPSLSLARRWFPLLCDGVSELHELFVAPLIHRDLKPSNVIVSQEALTIVDFGIARTYHDDAESDTTHFGTRSYAPPEQFGYGQTDERSDVYGLGMLLYYLLTERDPSPSLVRAGFQHESIPAALRPVLQRACAFDPDARYGSARELKKAFLEAATPSKSHSADDEPIQMDTSNCSEGLSDASAKGFTGRMRRAFESLRPTEIGGLVWDVLLTVTWILFTGIALYNPFVAEGVYTAWPFWLVAVQYWTFGPLFFTGLYAMLLDVRVLKRFLWKHPPSRTWPVRVIGLCSVILSIVAVVAVTAAAQSMGLPVAG